MRRSALISKERPRSSGCRSYDESVAAANVIVAYLEQRPGVLTRVDTVGWYDGPDLVLHEPD